MSADFVMRRFLLIAALALPTTHAQGTCLNSTFASLPFCDTSQPIPARVKDLVARFAQLNISTWSGLFSSWDGSFHVPALGIPGYEWWSEALHGLAHSPGVHFHGKTTFATMFPSPCASGTSLNSTLWHLTARAIATDARVFNNQGNVRYQRPRNPAKANAPLLNPPYAPETPPNTPPNRQASRTGAPTLTRFATLVGAAAKRWPGKTPPCLPHTRAPSSRGCSRARTQTLTA